MLKLSASLLAGMAAAVIASGAAQADVAISSAVTKNMTCSDGVCVPTAKNAVLNVNDLTGMLSAGDVTVKAGSGAVTIGIISPFAWATSHRLTLDAILNVNIKARVTVQGTAGLTITTNDGGTGGDLVFYPGGKVGFWDTASSLIINGNAYRLVATLRSLEKKRGLLEGSYALANDIHAHHKKYDRPPIHQFRGTFEGLGNSITNLDIEGPDPQGCEGMFGMTDGPPATIKDFNLRNVRVSASSPHANARAGALVGCNEATTIVNVSVDGSVTAEGGIVGGLVGVNYSSPIIRSHSTASVEGGVAGGLIGSSTGAIDQSYATGTVSGEYAGGLVGESGVAITNSYAMGSVTARDQLSAGGFSGQAVAGISASYSIGAVGGSGTLAGFVGVDDSEGGVGNAYWDLDTSGISDPSQGAGNIPNDPGITGLTDAQLKSGMPTGFDPAIWGQSPSINNGYPYLLANPPLQ